MNHNLKSKSIKNILGAILMVAASTSAYMVLSNYLLPVSAAIQADISTLSLIFTFASVSTIIASMFLGKLMQKIRVRVLISVAIVCFIAFFVTLAVADNVTIILTGAVLFGISMAFGGFGLAMTVISWWADRKIVGRAMSGLTIGIGVFSFISSPIVAGCIEKYGRVTALYHGVICGVIMLIATLFLISEHPNRYRSSDTRPADLESNSAAAVNIPGVPLGKILKTAPFWLAMLAIVSINTATTGFTNNASAFYQTFGVNAVKASYGISIFSVAKLFWSYLFGWLVDKRGLGVGTFVTGFFGVLTYIAGLFLSGFEGMVIMAAFASSLNFGGSLGSLLFPALYGGKESGTLIGWSNAASSVGTMLGAPIAASILTTTGNFNRFLIIAACLVLLCIVLIPYVSSKSTMEKMKQLQE